ncbi:MAG: PGPGW domain-containing protein [Dermatophilaceae bacterium]
MHRPVPPRAQALISGLESWARRGRARSLVLKLCVSIAGPLVVLAGIAMLVLPGPGLVVITLGVALLALEYRWARTSLGLIGSTLSRARDAALPPNASGGRRVVGVASAGALVAATTVLTAAISSYVGALVLL